jgi:hypothetical protein
LEVRGSTANQASANGPFIISDSTTPAKKMWMGYDSTADLFFINAGHVGVANKNLILQNQSGNVGIGTTTAPSEKLTLGSADKFGWDNGSGTVDANLYRSSANTLKTDSAFNVSKAFWSKFSSLTFSTTPIFDASTGNAFKLTLTGNITSSSIPNAQTGELITLILCQDGTGSHTMTWPSNLKLAGNSFTLSTSANKCDSLTAVFDGTNWYETSRAANL